MSRLFEQLEQRTFCSVSDLVSPLAPDVRTLAVSAARRSAVPAINLVGDYAGSYFNVTVGSGGNASATVQQQIGRRLVVVLRFDGTTLIGRGTIKGQIVRMKASTPPGAGPRVKVVVQGLTNGSGEAIEGSYRLNSPQSPVRRSIGSFSLVRLM